MLKFKKKTFDERLPFYSVMGLSINNKPYLFYGSEGEGHICIYYGDDFQYRYDIWEGGGGTMSIVPVKGKEGWAMASRGFYSMVNSGGSTIEIIRYNDGRFTHNKIADVPYLHRFNIVRGQDGTAYIVAATIAYYKENIDDWSHPGHVYFAVLPEDFESDFHLELIQVGGNYFKNHGFFKKTSDNEDKVFISSENGVFMFAPPVEMGREWTVKQIMDQPVSDISFIDIDGDGVEEMAAILPFHGNMFKVYKIFNSEYKEIYSYPAKNDFYHAIACGNIKGRAVFIGGARRLSANLFILIWDEEKGEISAQEVDSSIGPSNAEVFNFDSCELLLSANVETKEAAVYFIE